MFKKLLLGLLLLPSICIAQFLPTIDQISGDIDMVKNTSGNIYLTLEDEVEYNFLDELSNYNTTGSLLLDAGADLTITTLDSFLVSARTRNIDSWVWRTDGTGTFTDTTAKRTYYTPSEADYLSEYIMLSIAGYAMNGQDTLFDSKIIYMSTLAIAPYMTLPDTVYLLSNVEYRINDDAISAKDVDETDLTVDYVCVVGEEDSVGYVFNEDTTGYFSFVAYAKCDNVIKDTLTTILKIFDPLIYTDSITVLFVGNSLMDGDPIIDSIRTTVTGDSVVLKGAKTSGSLKHEGNSGYRYYDYVSGYRAGIGERSPFWIGSAFDFTSYRVDSCLSVDPLNFVIVQLGINDFSIDAVDIAWIEDTWLGYVQTFVDKILSDTTNHLILCMSPYCSNNDSVWEASAWNNRSQDFFIEKMHYGWTRLNQIYSGCRYSDRVTVSPQGAFIDRGTDYSLTDPVHPLASGHWNLAKSLRAVMEGLIVEDNETSFTLASTGTGLGVSTLRMQVSSNTTVTLDGTARFYTDAGGTTGESTSWIITSGALRTIYLKVPSGTANLSFPDKRLVTAWGNSSNDGWTSSTNAATLTKTSFPFANCLTLRLDGNNTAGWTTNEYAMAMTYHRVLGTNSIGGDTIPGPITTFYLGGSADATLHTNDIPSGCTAFTFQSTQGSMTGVISDLSDNASLANFTVNVPSTITGDIDDLPAAITYFYLSNCRVNTYTSGHTWNNNMNYFLLRQQATFGLDATEIDNLLIDLNGAAWAGAGRTLNVSAPNAPRTSASNEAVSALQAKSVTVTTAP